VCSCQRHGEAEVESEVALRWNPYCDLNHVIFLFLGFTFWCSLQTTGLKVMSATRGISRCLIRKLPTHATKNSWSSSQQLQKRHYAVGSYKAGSKPPTHGQPTNKSHPHLLRAGEVTPGISLSEYQDRRTRLMASLPNDDSVVICTAGEIKVSFLLSWFTEFSCSPRYQ